VAPAADHVGPDPAGGAPADGPADDEHPVPPGPPDNVEEADEESFPASDPPSSWAG